MIGKFREMGALYLLTFQFSEGNKEFNWDASPIISFRKYRHIFEPDVVCNFQLVRRQHVIQKELYLQVFFQCCWIVLSYCVLTKNNPTVCVLEDGAHSLVVSDTYMFQTNLKKTSISLRKTNGHCKDYLMHRSCPYSKTFHSSRNRHPRKELLPIWISGNTKPKTQVNPHECMKNRKKMIHSGLYRF